MMLLDMDSPASNYIQLLPGSCTQPSGGGNVVGYVIIIQLLHYLVVVHNLVVVVMLDVWTSQHQIIIQLLMTGSCTQPSGGGGSRSLTDYNNNSIIELQNIDNTINLSILDNNIMGNFSTKVLISISLLLKSHLEQHRHLLK